MLFFNSTNFTHLSILDNIWNKQNIDFISEYVMLTTNDNC